MDLVFELFNAASTRLARVDKATVVPEVGALVIVGDKNYRVRSHLWEVVPEHGAFIHIVLQEWEIAR